MFQFFARYILIILMIHSNSGTFDDGISFSWKSRRFQIFWLNDNLVILEKMYHGDSGPSMTIIPLFFGDDDISASSETNEVTLYFIRIK